MKTFTMSQEDYDALLKASQPTPYLIVGGVLPTDPRQHIISLWKDMGERMGFVWETAEPVNLEFPLVFKAEPLLKSF